MKEVFVMNISGDKRFEFGRFYRALENIGSIYITDNYSYTGIDRTEPFEPSDFLIHDGDRDYPRKTDGTNLNTISCIYLGKIGEYNVLRGVGSTVNGRSTNDTNYCYFVRSEKGMQVVLYYRLYSKVSYKSIHEHYLDDEWIDKMLQVAKDYYKSKGNTLIDNSTYTVTFYDFKMLNLLGV